MNIKDNCMHTCLHSTMAYLQDTSAYSKDISIISNKLNTNLILLCRSWVQCDGYCFSADATEINIEPEQY